MDTPPLADFAPPRRSLQELRAAGCTCISLTDGWVSRGCSVHWPDPKFLAWLHRIENGK